MIKPSLEEAAIEDVSAEIFRPNSQNKKKSVQKKIWTFK